MKERVHIHTLEVSRQGQIINFQVRIPRDAKRIVGILISENAPAGINVPTIASPFTANGVMGGTFPISDDSVSPNLAISPSRIPFPINVGSVLLQSKNKANFFYQEDVFHNDNSFAQGDFSVPTPVFVPRFTTSFFGSDIPNAFAQREFRGGANIKEVCMEIDVQSTKLFGMYTDVFNEQRKADSHYQVKLYFYYEQKRIISNEN